MVKLALYKGRSSGVFARLGDWAIRKWTRSAYSHCELVIDDVAYSSSLRDGGVRAKIIDIHSGKWDVIELPWASERDVKSYFALTCENPYGVADLIARQVLRFPGTDHVGQFCSEWCAVALGLPDARDYSPGSLGRLCFWLQSQPLRS